MPRSRFQSRSRDRMDRTWVQVRGNSSDGKVFHLVAADNGSVPPCLNDDATLGLVATRECTILAVTIAGSVAGINWIAFGFDEGVAGLPVLTPATHPASFFAFFGPQGLGLTSDEKYVQAYSSVSKGKRKLRHGHRLIGYREGDNWLNEDSLCVRMLVGY